MNQNKDVKIVSDEDWKHQAQKEKEKLSQTEEAKPSTGVNAGSRREQGVPPVGFLTLMNSIMIQALYSLGCLGVEGQETPAVNLELAKYHIDTLQMLEDKTKGNLTAEESRAISMALHELRMQYVQVAQNA